MPFEAAFGLPPGAPAQLDEEERMALSVVLAEMDGATFDWDAGQFVRRDR